MQNIAPYFDVCRDLGGMLEDDLTMLVGEVIPTSVAEGVVWGVGELFPENVVTDKVMNLEAFALRPSSSILEEVVSTDEVLKLEYVVVSDPLQPGHSHNHAFFVSTYEVLKLEYVV
ncbi:hypothetical protein L7F22_036162, partial [Adiantum nelumboides]|nr:hypothetical protein [Adiantum nelumboides]